MANIYDVAYYILDKIPNITTMKLQKLCYYSQAWSLAWDEEPIFEEDFQAWANGPVCYELYSHHRGMYKIDKSAFETVKSKEGLSSNQIETIEVVLEDYGNESPHFLSELTHKERPWKETRGSLSAGARSDATIGKDLMQEYYTGLLAVE